ncbi:hypothetical protein M0805_002518 [Coniferiporia weirii]|nr:hypothetical protein M0805_002518 [Coniferiporia weirii]
MPRVAAEKKTKVATKAANTRTSKVKDEDKPVKAKRAPSAYNLFMQKELQEWRKNNKDGKIKDGMVAVAALWRDSPENPKRGQTPAAKKAPKPKVSKENAKEKVKKPKAKKKEASSEEEEVEDDEDDE